MDQAISDGVVSAVNQVNFKVRASHNRHHVGVDKTLELLEPEVPASRKSVDEIVRSCVSCQTIDPTARERWKEGVISVDKLWFRVPIDLTHFNGKVFLTAVDCCSRYAVWKTLRSENAESIAFALEDLFVVS